MQNTYNQHLVETQENTVHLQKKEGKIALQRLGLLLFFVLFLYFIFPLNLYLGSTGLILLLGIFYKLVKKHEAIQDEIRLEQTKIQVIKNEITVLAGGDNVYSHGLNFAVSPHDYCDDLDIFGTRSLFHLMNRAQTSVGQEKLAQKLVRNTHQNNLIIEQQAVQELANQTDWRVRFQATLFDISAEMEAKATQLADITPPPTLRFEQFIGIYIKILPLIWVALVVAAINLPITLSLPLFMGLMGVNMYLSRINSSLTDNYFEQLSGLGKVINKYEQAVEIVKNKPFETSILQKIQEKLPHTSINPIRTFGHIVKRLDMRKNQLAALFIYLVLPFDMAEIIKLRKWVQTYPRFFADIRDVLGDMEFYTSVGTWRYNHPAWTFPTFTSSGSLYFEAENMGHPLIAGERVVTNSFSWTDANRLSIITGSNMSGKSTFLRTIGLNVILAYLGAPVFASSCKVQTGVRLISYMRIKDSLLQNTSTFKAEIDRIRLILQAIDRDEKVILLIDEMLRGTNSEDKLAGSLAMLDRIVESKVYGLVATHDLRMAEIKEENTQHVRNYYFEFSTNGGDLAFDYQLREGVCKSFNASLLLQSIGLFLKK